MPRRKRPAYGMEVCGMAKDCGGTPAFAVVLPICWSMRKTPVQSAIVSDRASSPTSLLQSESAGTTCTGSVHVVKVRPMQVFNAYIKSKAGVIVCERLWYSSMFESCVKTLISYSSTAEGLPDTGNQERM